MSEDFASLIERGNAARYANDFAGAERAYRGALAMQPDNAPALSALGLLLLAQGRYAEGWPLYEARRKFQPLLIERSGIPEWRGEDLAGKSIMIWPEQGLGDEIQMARYAPALKARGATVMLVCTPSLGRLFFGSLGVNVAALVDKAQLPTTDVYARSFSLPARFGTTLETIPPAPYLRAPPDAKTGGVGFVWRGGAAHPNDAGRSLPSADVLAPLGDKAELIDLQNPRGDFLDTAARVQALDLVISVDTAMAHLCGALGVPCWVMLPAERVDWRWMTGRADSPWYPSLRLFRQATPGDWAGVVDQMRAALPSLRRAAAAPPAPSAT
jgi:tetratricopeptide (TPR) repeat protein